MPVKFAKLPHSTTAEERFARFFKKEDGCWWWLGGKDRKGYGQFKYEGRMVKAHRFSFELYKEPVPKGLLVLHECDNPSCVNPCHLMMGSNLLNQQQAWARDRKSAVRKLSLDDVISIRASDLRQRILATQFGVHQSEISKIKTGSRGHGILSAAGGA